MDPQGNYTLQVPQMTTYQAARGPHFEKETFKGVAHLLLSQQRHLPPPSPPRSPLHLLNLPLKPEDSTDFLFNSPASGPPCLCPALSSPSQTELHMLVSLSGIPIAAGWDPSHLPRWFNTTFHEPFPRHNSFLFPPNSAAFYLSIITCKIVPYYWG